VNTPGEQARADLPLPGSKSAKKTRAASWMGRFLTLLAAPLVAVAVSALTGLGLLQNIPAQHALLAGLCIAILPALGLAALFGDNSLMRAVALWLWSLGLLIALPSYFPEQREPATRAGLILFSMPLSAESGDKVVETGLDFLRLFGPEPPAILRASPSLAEAPPRPSPKPNATAKSEKAVGDSAATRPSATRISYEGDGRSIRIAIHADGPEFGEDLDLVFDTGATLTTLNRRTLEILGIPVPRDAPTVIVHTASGEMEASLVLVDAFWLGNEVVEWVTVAVCEPCAANEVVGLLGLNISSHFRVSIDHDANEIEFVARKGRRNRKIDIQPWLNLEAMLSRWEDGRVEVSVTIENQAPRDISSTVLEFTCATEKFTVRLDPIEAHGTLTVPTSLPWGSQCEQFEIHPVAANWKIDRF
jgi:hypothetical protein